MNIFNKITLESMRKSHTRTLVTIIGVILSAAMITAVATFAVSLQGYMVKGAIAKYGSWHIGFLDVDAAFVQERSWDDKVADAVMFENIGYGILNGGKNPGKPYLFVAGFNQNAFDSLPINLVSGRLPENSGELLVPTHVAANGGVKFSIGDTLTLALGQRIDSSGSLSQHSPYLEGSETLVPSTERTFTVTGIYERPSFEEFSAPGYTLITGMDAEKGNSFSVFVTLAKPRQVHTYAKGTAGGHPYIMNDAVLRFMGLSDDNLFNALLYSAGGILVTLIMIGSVFLIYNAFNISLNERTRQFGILSSVGATSKQLQNSVLFEGLCIAAAGIPPGIAVGLGSIKLVLAIIARNFNSIAYSTVPLTLIVSAPALGIATVVSLITILISAYLPARKAANTPVMESLRQTNEIKIDSGALKTSKRAGLVYGLEGTLALKNFQRNKKRYRSVILSLTLSVVLFVSASAFGMYLQQAAELSIVDVDYDICFVTQEMEEGEVFQLYDELKTAAGVSSSSYQAILTYSCLVKASDLSNRYREFGGYTFDETNYLPMDIQLIEDSEYLSFIKDLGFSAEEYTSPDGKMTAVAKVSIYNEGSRQFELFDMFSDSTKTFTIIPETSSGPAADKGQSIDITFVDTIPLDTLPRNSNAPKSTVFMVVAPYQLKEKFEITGGPEELGLTFRSNTPSQTAAQMETMIQSAGVTSEYTLHNVSKILEQNRNIIFVVHVFTYVFVGMISLIAIANVFNTISTNIRLRRRELAMLRSIGMSDGSFKKMMNWECMFYGMRTLSFGLPAAAILSWLIHRGLVIGGADIPYRFPWDSILISIFGVFFIVFTTMLYAIHKLRGENIIDALRDEMT